MPCFTIKINYCLFSWPNLMKTWSILWLKRYPARIFWFGRCDWRSCWNVPWGCCSTCSVTLNRCSSGPLFFRALKLMIMPHAMDWWFFFFSSSSWLKSGKTERVHAVRDTSVLFLQCPIIKHTSNNFFVLWFAWVLPPRRGSPLACLFPLSLFNFE